MTAHAAPGTARAIADRVLRRDKARIRNLALMTILLWIAAAAIIPGIFLPFAAEVVKTLDQLNRAAAAEQLTPLQLVHDFGPLFRYGITVTLISFGLAILAALLASGTSIWLALEIRRSTLREVSANLAEISEQLRAITRRDVQPE